jgi:hypothetical protein
VYPPPATVPNDVGLLTVTGTPLLNMLLKTEHTVVDVQVVKYTPAAFDPLMAFAGKYI